MLKAIIKFDYSITTDKKKFMYTQIGNTQSDEFLSLTNAYHTAEHLLLLLYIIENETNIDVAFAICYSEISNLSVYNHISKCRSNEPLQHGRFRIHLLYDCVKAFRAIFRYLIHGKMKYKGERITIIEGGKLCSTSFLCNKRNQTRMQ